MKVATEPRTAIRILKVHNKDTLETDRDFLSLTEKALENDPDSVEILRVTEENGDPIGNNTNKAKITIQLDESNFEGLEPTNILHMYADYPKEFDLSIKFEGFIKSRAGNSFQLDRFPELNKTLRNKFKTLNSSTSSEILRQAVVNHQLRELHRAGQTKAA